jgi:hypothetical protein
MKIITTILIICFAFVAYCYAANSTYLDGKKNDRGLVFEQVEAKLSSIDDAGVDGVILTFSGKEDDRDVEFSMLIEKSVSLGHPVYIPSNKVFFMMAEKENSLALSLERGSTIQINAIGLKEGSEISGFLSLILRDGLLQGEFKSTIEKE